MNRKEEKELQALRDRLDEVRREKDEESSLLFAISRIKRDIHQAEVEEIRKQALPFLEAEEKLIKEVVNHAEGLSQTLEELLEVQTEIMSRHSKVVYRIPVTLTVGVRSILSTFKEKFPEFLGLPPRMTRRERQVEGARSRVEYLENQVKELRRKNKESQHKLEREVSEAEGRVRNARARLELLTQ